MPAYRILVIALPVAAVVGVGLWTARGPAASTLSAAPATIVALPASVPISVTAPRVASAVSAAPTAAAAAIPASLASRVDALMRSDDPRDAMQAYEAVEKCLLARRRAHAANLPPNPPVESEAALCGDLRSDQIQRRRVALEKAALAGEPGAAVDFLAEGPSGNGLLSDLDTTDPTPPTPEWVSRRDDYIERALARCDTYLPSYLGLVAQGDKALRRPALEYWLGRVSCPGRPAANTTPLAEDAQAQAYLNGLGINGWQR